MLNVNVTSTQQQPQLQAITDMVTTASGILTHKDPKQLGWNNNWDGNIYVYKAGGRRHRISNEQS